MSRLASSGGSGFVTSCQGITLVNANGPGVVLSAQCINNDANVVISGLNLGESAQSSPKKYH